MTGRDDGMKFAEQYGPWAVVAGASEGIGSAVARQLGDRGVNVVLVSRRQAVLDEVAATIRSETRTAAIDLSASDAVESLAKATSDLEIGLLVYNAGADPYMLQFLDQPADVWQEMVTRNCVTLLGATHHFASGMAERGRGGIVLVTSGAAWAGGAHLVTYGATKAFDLILGEALWAELKPRGVDVLSMVLGMTDTPAFRKLTNDREMEGVADAEDVARDMLENLPNGPTFPPEPSLFSGVDRRTAVELMSQGSAAMKG
jgi:short-subunit dehydrogenase